MISSRDGAAAADMRAIVTVDARIQTRTRSASAASSVIDSTRWVLLATAIAPPRQPVVGIHPRSGGISTTKWTKFVQLWFAWWVGAVPRHGLGVRGFSRNP